jgi:hypothetical protein
MMDFVDFILLVTFRGTVTHLPKAKAGRPVLIARPLEEQKQIPRYFARVKAKRPFGSAVLAD